MPRTVQAFALVEENILNHFTVMALTAKDYGALVKNLAIRGVVGGQGYDALHLECARRSGAERIYTFNLRHFAALAQDGTAKILAP